MATDVATSPGATATNAVQPVLRIQVSTLPPFQTVIWGPNETFTCVGIGPQLYDWIAKYLKFSYVLVPVTEKTIMKMGHYNASLRLFMSGAVDVVTTPNLEMSLVNSKYMEMSHPYLFQQTKLLLPAPEEDASAWPVIAPFSPMVWLGFVVVLFTMPLFMTIFFKMLCKMTNNEERNNQQNSFGSNFLYVFAVFTNHELGNNWINRQTARRSALLILVGFWLLAMTVAVNSYAGVFASFITVPKLKQTIDTLEDLAADRDLSIGSRAHSEMIDRMMTAESGVYKALGDKLRSDSSGLFGNDNRRNQLIASKKYAMILAEGMAYHAMALDYMKTKSCHYTASPPLPYSTYMSFGLSKDGKYNQDVNKAMMRLWETGLVKKWSADGIPRYQQCLIKKNPTAVRRPIKLTDLASAFYVLLIGIGISIFVFLIEMIVKLGNKIRDERQIGTIDTIKEDGETGGFGKAEESVTEQIENDEGASAPNQVSYANC